MSQKRPGPVAPPPPKPANRIIPPPPPAVHRLASVQPKTVPAPRLAPPPLPQRPPTVPAAGPPPPAPARPVLQPRILPVPPPLRPAPPLPPPLPSRVVQGVIVDRKGGDELTDQDVADLITLHGLKDKGARHLRTLHRMKARRVLATALDQAVAKDAGPKIAPAKKKKGATGPRGFSKASADRTFKSVTLPSKTTFSGRWTANITVSGSRSFSSDRDAQVLRHVSAQLFWYIRNQLGHSSEQEVQSMYINDRILIAANEDGSIRALAQDFQKKAKDHIRKILEQMQEKDERSRVNALKLTSLLSGKRVFNKIAAVDTLMAIVENGSFAEVDISDAQGCKDAITKSSYKQKLVLTVGGGDLHAEQKLVLALYQSGSKGAVVYGKKRPCTACLATLKFANDKLKLGIRHNLHPGGYWGTANQGLVNLVKLAVQRNALTAKEAQQWLDTHTQGHQTYQSQPVVKGKKRKTLVTQTVAFDPSRLAGESIYDSASESEGED